MNSLNFLKRAAFCAAPLFFLMAAPAAAFCSARAGGAAYIAVTPVWLAFPFVLLLLMIAGAPLLFPRFWEHHYQKVSIILTLPVLLWYVFSGGHGLDLLEHTLEEYLSFIALLSSLFIVAGGILIRIGRRGSPAVNLMLLLSGALLANVIGTTGASMLLIRPYLRINKGRLKAFHIVFFIFIVSNIGGGLTPIGDPPLFLGFLRGVPFFWVLARLWLPWLLTIVALCLIFMVFDAIVGKSDAEIDVSGGIQIRGKRNFLFLGLLILSVFLDPAVIDGFPSLQQMFHLPFGIREVIMSVIAVIAYRSADKEALKGNEFNFEPIREISFLFIGIFFTMIPALQLIGGYARLNADGFSVTRFYWFTGILSGVLDNAPTYLNFFAGALGKFGLDAGNPVDVKLFAQGVASPIVGDTSSELYLLAISAASVFFGALTYIGNAPNFMVRNIAAQTEADVPDFLEYVYRYSIPLLLPLFGTLWFFMFNY
ncbi:MAG: citrate transporter [Chlorobiaceae bacterium]|nr:citrate transporter [Chlorobiaceae bacterium]